MTDPTDPDALDELSRECDRMEGAACTPKAWRLLCRATLRESRRILVETQRALNELANADIPSLGYANAVVQLDASAARFHELMSLRQRIDSNIVEVNAVAGDRP